MEILSAIDDEHRDDFQIERRIETAQRAWLRDGQLLADYRNEKVTALDSLILERSYLREFTQSATPDSDELMRIESHVMERLRFVGDMLDDLRPRRELYYKQIRETEQVNRKIRDKVQRARIALMVWQRAHGELADGVTDPAKINVGAIAASILAAAGP